MTIKCMQPPAYSNRNKSISWKYSATESLSLSSTIKESFNLNNKRIRGQIILSRMFITYRKVKMSILGRLMRV